MRDSNVGGSIHAGRDVHIGDGNSYKLLTQCSNEELREEELHRNSLLKKERKRKTDIMVPIFCIAAVLVVVAAVWYFIRGQMNTVSALTGFAGLVVAYVNLQKGEEKSEFEQRQLAALNEINLILRERGAR